MTVSKPFMICEWPISQQKHHMEEIVQNLSGQVSCIDGDVGIEVALKQGGF